MVNILAAARHPPARHGGVGADLRRRPAAESRAAAQLPDRLLARGRARLLHDAARGCCATGSAAQVTALSEREPVEFPAPVGELEAFHTAGGLSTMAFRYEGKIPTMEYKTLRYPGPRRRSWRRSASSGCSTLDPVDVKGMKVVPRDVFVAAMGPKLRKPKGRDLVALRVIVTRHEGRQARRASVRARRSVRRDAAASAR